MSKEIKEFNYFKVYLFVLVIFTLLTILINIKAKLNINEIDSLLSTFIIVLTVFYPATIGILTSYDLSCVLKDQIREHYNKKIDQYMGIAHSIIILSLLLFIIQIIFNKNILKHISLTILLFNIIYIIWLFFSFIKRKKELDLKKVTALKHIKNMDNDKNFDIDKQQKIIIKKLCELEDKINNNFDK